MVVAHRPLQDVLERWGQSNLTFVQVARKHRGFVLDQRMVVKYEAQAMAPMLESVAVDNAVPVKVARVNVEAHEELTEQYGVRAVPTLLIFNQGSLQDQIFGRTTEQAVCERLERLKRISTR